MRSAGFLYRPNGTNRGGSTGLQRSGVVAHGIAIPSLRSLQGIGCECLSGLGDWNEQNPTLSQWNYDSYTPMPNMPAAGAGAAVSPQAVVTPVVQPTEVAAVTQILPTGPSSSMVVTNSTTCTPPQTSSALAQQALNCTPGSDSALDPLSQAVACSLQTFNAPAVSAPAAISPMMLAVLALLGLAIVT